MVGHVERFPAELQLGQFADAEFLYKAGVKLPLAGSKQDISACVADRIRSRGAEGGGVEPAGNSGVLDIRVSDNVGTKSGICAVEYEYAAPPLPVSLKATPSTL